MPINSEPIYVAPPASPSTKQRYTVAADTTYILLNVVAFIVLFAIARLLLLWRNDSLMTGIPLRDVFIAFGTGARFDLIMSSYALTPLVLAMLLPAGLSRRRWCNIWLGLMAFVYSFLAALELDFYHEFHARLNSMVFQYVEEDPKTVVSMLWYGFPVVRYFALCGALTAAMVWATCRIDRVTRKAQLLPASYRTRLVAALILIIATAAATRGTFRSGPPLRWADAYKTTHLFTNHLALNGAFTLMKAARQDVGKQKNPWLHAMPDAKALALVRAHWVEPQEKLLAPATLPLFRHVTAAANPQPSPYKNVVLIIDESFSAQRTGVFGNTLHITPRFDELASQGLLFNHFFSQGTHTHQGMFATMACFPNLPHYEYLMKQPEGANNFSGLTRVLAERDYKSLYVYNGDFPGIINTDFSVRSICSDLSAATILLTRVFRIVRGACRMRTCLIAVLPRSANCSRTVSRISSYCRRYQIMRPMHCRPSCRRQPVEINGQRDQHLTAMRYNDYALGVFFDRIKKSGNFDNTLFVFLGDHGFSGGEQITDIDLWRFHIPLLIWGKDIQAHYGKTRSVVGSQVDVVPTIMGILGGDYDHDCWGRDLLSLPANDAGIAIIKPSGSDFTTAIIEGNKILVRPPNVTPLLYSYTTLPHLTATPLNDAQSQQQMTTLMSAYIQTATRALLDNHVGHGDHVQQAAAKN